VEPTSPATPQATATGVPQASAIVVQQGPAGRRAVTLTFDAGADAGFTVQILEVLAGAGVKAAFGLTGKWAEQNPELVASIAAAGHDLINHSYDHSSFTGLSTSAPPLSQAARFEQLDRTEGIVLGLTGRSTRPLFRPPYGDYDESVNRDLALRGYLYNVMWTVDSRGWQGIAAEEIVQRCLSLAVPGAIYVFHVGSASQDAAALPAVIEGLRAAGYEMVPLSQILP
jgi:peptidoglycan/xylan/chitin deacetylase (PgdA/CDA1 family)